jgi:hypothetical protein
LCSVAKDVDHGVCDLGRGPTSTSSTVALAVAGVIASTTTGGLGVTQTFALGVGDRRVWAHEPVMAIVLLVLLVSPPCEWISARLARIAAKPSVGPEVEAGPGGRLAFVANAGPLVRRGFAAGRGGGVLV